jgi:glutaminyl-tRNA synthetase
VLTKDPVDQVDDMEVANHPDNTALGRRRVPFAREVYIERDDFMEDPPKKFFRLAPGREVRLRSAYLVTCTDVIKNAAGEIVELRGTYDPATRGGDAPDGRKVKATLHWVSAKHAADAEVRLYERLFSSEDPEEAAARANTEFTAMLNAASLEVLQGCKVEPSLASPDAGTRYQFERQGYFSADVDSRPDAPVFNRTVSLKDSWTKTSNA